MYSISQMEYRSCAFNNNHGCHWRGCMVVFNFLQTASFQKVTNTISASPLMTKKDKLNQRGKLM